MFYVFDLDNTISDPSHRLHLVRGVEKNYDEFFKRSSDDAPKYHAIKLLTQLKHLGNRVEIWSGRSDIVRQQTVEWLRRYGVPYDKLRMRKHGDYTKDVELKRSWLKEETTKPDIIFDDRQSVVNMWRAEGVPCYQVDQWPEIDQVGSDLELIPPYDKDKAMLVVMVGPSGGGKTTTALVKGNNYAIISTDEIRRILCNDFKDQSRNHETFVAAHRLVKTYIESGIPVIFDATNLRNKDRKAVVDLCPPQYKVEYWVVDRPMDEKLRDDDYRHKVIMKTGENLLDYHQHIFDSNLKDIMNGDGYKNVTVIDYRT